MVAVLRFALALTLGLASVSCTSLSGDPTLFVASTPQGARILVDGEDTGRTTPAMLELGGFWGGSDFELRLELEGYEPETRQIRHHTTTGTSRWNDGVCGQLLTIPAPLWWTLGDWFLPFKMAWRYEPHEVHAVLYANGKAPFRSTGR